MGIMLVVAGCVAALGAGSGTGWAIGRRARRRTPPAEPSENIHPDLQAQRVARWLAPPVPVPWDDDSSYALVAAFESAVVRHSQFKAHIAFGTDDELSAYATAQDLADRVGDWRGQVIRAIDGYDARDDDAHMTLRVCSAESSASSSGNRM